MKLHISGRTDRGRRRRHNEDTFSVCADLTRETWNEIPSDPVVPGELGAVCVIADGMGGLSDGAQAANVAVEAIHCFFDQPESRRIATLSESELIPAVQDHLLGAIQYAHHSVARAAAESREMGTTILLIWFLRNTAYLAWVGDSRCYLLRRRNDTLHLQLESEDHSLVWQQVRQGILSPEAARTHPQSNILLQSLGDPRKEPRPGFKPILLKPGDRFLLCTDGLHGMLAHREIAELLAESDHTPWRTAANLVSAANAFGGKDNITLLLIDVLEDAPVPIPKFPYQRILILSLSLMLVLLLFLGGNIIRIENKMKETVTSKALPRRDSSQMAHAATETESTTVDTARLDNFLTGDHSSPSAGNLTSDDAPNRNPQPAPETRNAPSGHRPETFSSEKAVGLERSSRKGPATVRSDSSPPPLAALPNSPSSSVANSPLEQRSDQQNSVEVSTRASENEHPQTREELFQCILSLRKEALDRDLDIKSQEERLKKLTNRKGDNLKKNAPEKDLRSLLDELKKLLGTSYSCQTEP